MGQIQVPDESQSPAAVLEEVPVIRDADLAGNASLGIVIDRPRNRLLVAVADLFGSRYGALAAYDLSSWNRLFLAQLSGPGTSAYCFDTLLLRFIVTGAWGSLLKTKLI